ncbi:MAG: tRNA (adenosine(37)-N6)-threonylcarbamoyltransferase complex ATPase subunit type 1 TsaE [Acidobacteria bacterium]|nr:tRNA (adenosine(37)-N6)-threonylcarbamoyltransferase complex ATPase subunit type 1 TsaE [Acidobacteriota bacterium]
MHEWKVASARETALVAREIAALLLPGAIVQLTGNLGAGKTTLTKSLVAAWGVDSEDSVSSPTFTLIHEYGEPVRVYHIDLYRLETPREFHGLGLDDIFESGARVLVEWGEKFAPLLPTDRYIVEIEHAGGDARRITLTDRR